MAGLNFDITGDNSNFLRRLEEARTGIASTSKQIEKEGTSIEAMFGRMAKGAAVLGLGFSATQLINDIIRVRGEFQQLEIAFETMLKSKEKASALMAQLTDTAAKTPFDLQSVAHGAKQLLAYGTASEEVNDTLVRLGNIASGLSIPLGDLVYLYGTTQTQGRLFTQDVRQFMGRGIPLVKELATELGKTEQQINEMVTAGKIGFPEVEKVIRNMTGESGQFYNLMEKQSASLTGQISNLGDAWDGMLNKLGTQTQGIASAGISATTSLIENYEEVGKILAGLVVVYGTYRTAVMLVAAAQSLQAAGIGVLTAKEAIHYAWLVATKKAQLALNAAMLTNPYVLLATAVVGTVAAVWALHDGTTAAEKAQKKFNEEKEEAIKREAAHKSHIESLISTIQDETVAEMNRIGALDQLNAAYPHLFAKYVDEKGYLRDIIGYKKEIAEFDAKVSVGIAERQAERAKQALIRVNKEINYRSGSTTGTTKHFRNKTTSELREMQSGLLKEYQLKKDVYDKLDGLNKKASESHVEETKNKSYWETQKKEAETALDSIASKQRTLLNAGKFDGIDAAVVSNYKTQSKLLEEAQKELKAYDTSGKSEKQQESAADKLRKEQAKSAEEILAIRRQNQQDEINLRKEGAEKKLKQIELDYQKELDTIKKQERDWSKAQKGKLTQEQSIEISTRYTNADKKREKSIGDDTKERLVAEQQALNEYLTRYGTFQQQKLAIAQEYAEKIKKAQEENGVNGAQVKLLQKEQHEKTSAIDVASIKANMDWVAVFGEFGGMFSDMVKPALKEAKKYIKTDEFKNSDQASQKTLIDAISQMEKSLGGSGGLNFKKLGQDVQIYQNSLRELNNAKEEEINAINKLKKAQEDYEKALKSGTEEEKNAASQAVDTAQQNADTASTNVSTQTNIANQSQQGLSDTATNLKANMNNVTEGLSKLASGGLRNAYSGIIQATNGIKDAIGKTSESLREVPIIGWILSIIDVLKDGLSNLVGGLLDAIFNAVSGIIGDVLSGDLFVTIGESLVTGISKILDAVTFGGFGSWVNAGESDETLKDDIELLSKSNEDLKTAIDNLAEKMDSASVADATDLYNSQKENLKKQMANTQEMMQRSGAAWSNGWLGINGSHSSNANINDSMSSGDWSRISSVIGRTVNGAGDFWKLTSEEMAKVAIDATDLYSKIKSYADDGYEDAGQYMDSYINYYKQLEELENTWREKLTSASFDSVRDDFKSALMDMEADTEDFAASFEELMKNAIFESLMTEKYDLLLQDWYKDFATSMDGGKLTEEEQGALKKSWEDIVNQGIAERDALYDTMGWNKSSSSSSQDSTNGGFQTMSQDTGDELNGRFTALQISNEEIKNSMLSMLVSMNLISVSTNTNGITLMEIKNIALMSNSHLEDIAKYTKELIGFKQTIANIETSAKAMAGK